MSDRTEAEALASAIPVTIGGRPYTLRALAIEDSEAWQELLGRTIAGVDLPDGLDAADTLAALGSQGSRKMRELLLAYDLDHVLPALGKVASQRDVYLALRGVLAAEYPFVTDLRSVAEAFGPQLRPLLAVVVGSLIRASGTNGPSPTGDSPPALSVVSSAESSSSSSGATAASA